MTDRVEEIEGRHEADSVLHDAGLNIDQRGAHKDRAFLLSTIRALQAEVGELRGRLDATKCTNNSPGRLTGFRQVEHPCEDCIDDWCQMNCGPATPSLEKDND
jgi:hypothetical protein